MHSKNLLTPKRQHFNRFAYLLEPKIDYQNSKIQKEFSFFSIDPCSQNPCKFAQGSSQVKQQQTQISLTGQKKRKPLKYELQSQNYELFRRQIDKKQSLNSFLVYTPQKAEIKDQFSIYNDISTIQYTKSNQMHTHRNLFESIMESQGQNNHNFSSQQINRSLKHLWKVQTQNEVEDETNVSKKPKKHELIKLELSESDDQSKNSNTLFLKKHLRTMTQENYNYDKSKKSKYISTAQKYEPLVRFTLKSQIESIQISNPSKSCQIQQSSILEVFNPKENKMKGVTIGTQKTKKMSQKLQECSNLEYDNSISVTPNNSQSSCVFASHKSIRLGRRTIDKY